MRCEDRCPYHTECTLDLSGAVLDYDGLAVLNRYRAESGKNCGDAVWAYGNMTEDQALQAQSIMTGG